MATIPSALSQHLQAIEDALRAALTDGPAELTAASRYVLGWENLDGSPAGGASGKRIRPALVLFGASLFTDRPEVALPGAVAVELVHNFSLVHDEIQDHDMARHGRPTLYAVHGAAQAINVGDFIYARAIDALLKASAPAEARVAALNMLQDAIVRMIEGQWRDISFESRLDVDTADYTQMIAGKTGAMLAVPLAIGAVLAGATPAAAQSLRAWGEKVGLAFQVQDDYLGIWGEPDHTGKSNTNDILRKKKTLPIVHGLTTPAGPVIREAYAKEALAPADVEAVVSALNEAGSDRFTRDSAGALVTEAAALLDNLDLSPRQREQLREVGEYLVNRDG